MSFDWDAVRADKPFDELDLYDISLQRGTDKSIGRWLHDYKTGEEGRKPYGVRHCQLIRLAVQMGYYTEAEAALERMGIK